MCRYCGQAAKSVKETHIHVTETHIRVEEIHIRVRETQMRVKRDPYKCHKGQACRYGVATVSKID